MITFNFFFFRNKKKKIKNYFFFILQELTQNGFAVTEATLGGPGLIVEELAY